ncbi:MAG TPA: hypothetical protein VNG53_09400 [Bacteroidia bacterium]|nr:hypothetical protein [Bacteroidia bacterium]
MARVLKNEKEIAEAINKYTNCLKQRDKRRELWKTETKDKIVEILMLVKNSFESNWYVQQLADSAGNETVNIGFGCEMIDSSSLIIKEGGYLAYAQSYNGKIHVFIVFPYMKIKEIVSEFFETIEPREITEEKISQHIIKFLEAMSKWEGEDRLPIGYKIEKSN